MKRAYLFLLILFLAFACENEAVGPKSLTGEWEWVKTGGGLANHIQETPQSTGNAVTLVLEDDQTYRKYTNGVLTSQGSYSSSKRKCIHDHQEKEVLTFSGDQEMMIESLDGQFLYVSDENYDGLDSQYRRAGPLSQQ